MLAISVLYSGVTTSQQASPRVHGTFLTGSNHNSASVSGCDARKATLAVVKGIRSDSRWTVPAQQDFSCLEAQQHSLICGPRLRLSLEAGTKWTHESCFSVSMLLSKVCCDLAAVADVPCPAGREVRLAALRPMAASSSAYIDASLAIDGASSGPLSGLTFAAKDMYDVSSTHRSCHRGRRSCEYVLHR